MRNFLFLLFILFSFDAGACSAFFFNSGSKLLAKNFDWSSGEGYLLKNNRGQQKYAYGFRGGDIASWISKYGSVTFNQIGKEFPYGGINEKGLVIEQLWLSNSEYEDNKSATISELEWIQYQLDQYDSVDAVIKNVHTLTIKPIATVHYLVADAQGVSAVIEFINGKAVIDRKQGLTHVITNETSADSRKYFSGLSNIDRNSRHALDRYSILKNELNVQSLNISAAFSKLKTVEENQADYKTYWSIVYDTDKLEIYYSSLSHPNIKKVSLSDFNFAQNTVTEFARINTEQTSFTPYSPADNLKLVKNTAKMMNIEFDILKANAHQMQPDQMVTDEIFRNKYTDLLVKFIINSTKGYIYYTVANNEESFATIVVIYVASYRQKPQSIVKYCTPYRKERLQLLVFRIPTPTKEWTPIFLVFR